MDGGTIVIEDYLSIRPENKQRIIDLVKSKRMFIVNWYTLPETNTVAPESLVRNLLLGHRTAAELGRRHEVGLHRDELRSTFAVAATV